MGLELTTNHNSLKSKDLHSPSNLKNEEMTKSLILSHDFMGEKGSNTSEGLQSSKS